MLELQIDGERIWDEEKEEFVATILPTRLKLEHSLISIKKWESKWHKAFLGKQEKSYEEIIDYVRCMCLNTNQVSDLVFRYFNQLTKAKQYVEQIVSYIKDPMTASCFLDDGNAALTKGFHTDVITNEIIYYWMITFNIPVEFERWHLEQLITLIKVIAKKNEPPKKMSSEAAAAQRKALNEARKAKYKTNG